MKIHVSFEECWKSKVRYKVLETSGIDTAVCIYQSKSELDVARLKSGDPHGLRGISGCLHPRESISSIFRPYLAEKGTGFFANCFERWVYRRVIRCIQGLGLRYVDRAETRFQTIPATNLSWPEPRSESKPRYTAEASTFSLISRQPLCEIPCQLHSSRYTSTAV